MAIINAGPYSPVEYAELAKEATLAGLRSGWVACAVDSMSEGLIKTPADLARVLVPIASAIGNTTFTEPVAGVCPRQLSKENSMTTIIPTHAPTNPANITIRHGAPPIAKRRSRNTPDPVKDAMLKLKEGEFFTLDPSAFKKASIAQKATALKKEGGIDKRVSVYEAIDKSIVVHFRTGEAE